VPISTSEMVDHDQVVPGRGIRRSVVMMERSWKQKVIGTVMYLTVSAVFSLLTSLQFFRMMGVVPKSPSVVETVSAFSAYQAYTSNQSDIIAADMKQVFALSKALQKDDCLTRQRNATVEQLNAKNRTGEFVKDYCTVFVNRAWAHAATFTAPGNCGNKFAWDNRMILWVAASSLKPCQFPIQGGGGCMFGLFHQFQNCSGATTETFDSWTPDLANYNLLVCKEVELDIQSIYNTYTGRQNNADFWQSLRRRLAYDYDYFTRALDAITEFPDFNLDLKAELETIQLRFTEFNLKAQYQINYMQGLSLKLQQINALPVLSSLPGLRANIPAFEASTPAIPSVTLNAMDVGFGDIDTNLGLFKNYNPPPLATYDPKAPNLDLPTFSPSYPNITLSDSTLLADVTSVIQTLLRFVTNLERLDLLVRLFAWIGQLSFLVRAVKRDMTTLKSKIRSCIGYIMQNAVVLLYVGIFLYAASYFVSFRGLNFDFAGAELNVQCENQVIASNLKDLADYQETLATARTECDTRISEGNAETTEMNADLVNQITSKVSNFERAYRNVRSSAFSYVYDPDIIVPAFTNRVPADFHLPSDSRLNALAGKNVSYQSLFPIETYVINSTVCTDDPNAQAVQVNANELAAQMRILISALILIVLFLNLSSRLVTISLLNWFWMELTHGWVFDEAFHSQELKKKINSKKRTAVLFTLVGFGLVGAVIVYGKIYLRDRLPDSF